MIVMRNGTKVADQPRGELDRSSLIHLMTGRDINIDRRSGREGVADAPVAQGGPTCRAKNTLRMSRLNCVLVRSLASRACSALDAQIWRFPYLACCRPIRALSMSMENR